MPSIINSNIVSLNAQRNLSTSQSALATSIQRLSSGLRVNSAKDDAAGLSIASRMSAQINGMNTAIRNANDAISLSQTAEGALNAVSDNMQRIRELAVQSSNATNNSVDRASLDAEVQQLKDEIARVGSQTAFNGVKLLDGTFAGANFQVGANYDESIVVTNMANVTLNALGGTVTTASTTLNSASTALSGYATSIASGGVTINGVNIGAIAAATSGKQRAAQLVDAITQASALQANAAALTGVSASYDGVNDVLTINSTNASYLAGNLVVGGTTNLATVAGFANAATTATSISGIANANVLTYGNAQNTILQMDAALASVNSSRAGLGATQNRFMSVIANLQINAENQSAAKSRIMDADYAAETANMTRNQILQQAGTAMLAQANALPNTVLTLLK